MKKIEIKISGKPVSAQAGETIVNALWVAGKGDQLKRDVPVEFVVLARSRFDMPTANREERNWLA